MIPKTTEQLAAEYYQAELKKARVELEQETALKVGYYNQAAEGWQKFREAERRIEQLESALRLVGDTSDPGLPCFCDGGNHNPSHPTERCRKIRSLIAGISNLSDSPKPIDSSESESVACPRCGVEFPHRCEYDPD